MRQNGYNTKPNENIAQYFNDASLPSQQETLGQIVVEILRAGKSISRKAICTKLLTRLEQCNSQEQERHYQELIGMLFGRGD